MDFEEFKKYHNANYHDGDSTFDELNYKKSNGDDFDNEFVQDCFDHFEAGQQSKQAEIKKAVLSLRNEFNLWADDTEQFHAIEAQIEQLEELLK